MAGPSAMTPDRWRRVAGVVEVVLELDRPLRAAYLDVLGEQDPDLRRQVLAAVELAGGAETPTPDPDATTAAGEGDATPIERLGPYRVVDVLGEGGMGRVLLGERDDGEIEKRVAIKVLATGFGLPIVHQRFLSERQILAQLDHPNIARLLDAGTTPDGRSYLVMEAIDGVPIDRYCADAELSLRERLALFRKVCAAVGHAHQQLVVHRDLKPSNILVDRAGEPKLLDFGIAKLLDPASFPMPVDEVTRTALRPMTPAWASPEQLQGTPITTATDVYALGLLLYKLLAGRLPHAPHTPPAERLRQVLSDEAPTRPSAAVSAEDRVLARNLRGDLDNIVAKALRTEPAARYASVAALDDDLRRFLDGEAVTATRGTWRYRAAKFASRHRWPVATAIVTVLLIGLFVTRLAIERDRARAESRRTEITRDFLATMLASADRDARQRGNVDLHTLLDEARGRLETGIIEDRQALSGLHEMLGDAYVSLGEFETAVFLFRQALASTDPDAEARRSAIRFKTGVAFKAGGYFDAALDELAQVGWDTPDLRAESANLLLEISFVESHQGRLRDAWRTARQAVELSDRVAEPSSIDELAALYWIGILEDTGHSSACREFLRRVYLHGTATSSRILSTWSSLYGLDNDHRHSVALAEIALARDLESSHPTNTSSVSGLLGLGRYYGQAGEVARARRTLALATEATKQQLALVASDLRARYHFALAAFYQAEIDQRVGDEAAAIRHLERAISILEAIRAEEQILYVENTYAMALMLAGRVDEARPVVQWLVDAGFRRADFVELVERTGALPHPVPPLLDLDLTLPPHLQAWLDGPPKRPLPWDDPELADLPRGDALLDSIEERLRAETPGETASDS